MAHSIGQFFGMSGMAVDVQGKYIGFIGDRGNGRYPIPFLLLPQNAWAWAKVKFLDNMVAFDKHFKDTTVWDKLWTTSAEEITLKEKLLPRLLALPTLSRNPSTHREGPTPPTIYAALSKTTSTMAKHKSNATNGTSSLTGALRHPKKNEVSLLNIGMPNPALCQDQEFLDWCNTRIQITLGEEPQLPGEPEQGTRDLHLVEQISNNMGRSFLAGVQALAPTIAGAA
jgi:hypothetical protein